MSNGVGLGLRLDFIHEVVEALERGGDAALGPIRFFEVAPENYMRRGGYYGAEGTPVGDP